LASFFEGKMSGAERSERSLELPPGQSVRIVNGIRCVATDLGAKDLRGAFEAAPNIHRSSSLVFRKRSTPAQTRLNKEQLEFLR